MGGVPAEKSGRLDGFGWLFAVLGAGMLANAFWMLIGPLHWYNELDSALILNWIRLEVIYVYCLGGFSKNPSPFGALNIFSLSIICLHVSIIFQQLTPKPLIFQHQVRRFKALTSKYQKELRL